MSAEVLITDATTGETRAYIDSLLERTEDDYYYIWEEGNYGCDCNRSLFFGRAINTPEDKIDEAPCGHIRFKVKIVFGGETVYDEDEP